MYLVIIDILMLVVTTFSLGYQCVYLVIIDIIMLVVTKCLGYQCLCI